MKDTKLRKFQRIGVKKIQEFKGRALLADQMGLGKTIQVLSWIKQHLIGGPILIVCPASIKWHWQNEAKKHVHMRAVVLSGKKPPPRDKFKLKADRIYIINYDILGSPLNEDSWVSLLLTLDVKCVVYDEVHYAKSIKAQRTKACRALARTSPYVIGVSGTPLTNRPAELWPALNMIRPDLYPNFQPYAFRYCEPRKTFWGWDYRGAANLDELHGKLREQMMIRRRKKDVLLDLPSKTRSVVPLEMENRKEYDFALKDFLRWLRKRSPKKAHSAAMAERLVKMGYLKRLAGQLKLKPVIAWITDFLEGSGEKLILFAVHKAVIAAIHNHFKKISVVVDGSVVGRQRQDTIDHFNVDKKIRLFIGNIQAAGVGWSCSATSCVAFAELGWTPGEHSQAEDRVHGIGRGKKGKRASAWYLVARDSIEEYLCTLLQTKQINLDETLDGGVTDDGIAIHDQLLELLKEKE